jgi:adenosine kinase
MKDFFLKGAEHFSLSFQTNIEELFFGGCAGNIAYTCHLLGDKPYIVSVVGNDFDKYKKWLEENKISCDYIYVDKNKNTASAYMLTDKMNSQLTMFSVGAMQDISSLSNFDFNKLPDIDYAIISPGFPYSMLYFAQSCIEKKIPYLVDPGQSLTALTHDALISLIDSSDGFIVNEYEGELIEKKMAMPLSRIAKRTSFLIRTVGCKGAEIYHEGKIKKVPAVSGLDIKDVTGAGDAFRSGFIHGFVGGESLERACQIGHTAASFVVEQKGTQTHKFTLESFTQRLKKHYGS